MMQNRVTGPLVLGASGKLGRALAQLQLPWFSDAVWQSRNPVPKGAHKTLTWDILQEPAPAVVPRVIIVLAGVTTGAPAELAQNTALALAACDLAERAGGVRVLLTSSQAVYGPQPGLLSEDTPCTPNTAYGQAKLAMERAVAGRSNVTCLRLGNVVGCDAISGAMMRGGVILDRFADGQSPRRAMIGPATLGGVLQGLADHVAPLPPVLNVAAQGLVAMADLLVAANVSWVWQEAAPGALRALALDLSRLQSLIPVPAADPHDLIAQARRAGWGVAA